MSCTVLVVDDEAALCQFLAEVFQDEGYQPVCLVDSRTAFAQLQQGVIQPDLIVLDLMMPGLNGYAFREQLTHDPRLKTVPVIVLTALSQAQVKGTNTYEDVVVHKPFDLNALLLLVAQYCTGTD